MKGLKKIIKAIKKFFLGIFNFIDRVIVTPVTKFGLFLGEKTDKNAGKFEKWLNKKNTLVFISLFMALLLFFYVDNQASTVIDSAAEVFIIKRLRLLIIKKLMLLRVFLRLLMLL